MPILSAGLLSLTSTLRLGFRCCSMSLSVASDAKAGGTTAGAGLLIEAGALEEAGGASGAVGADACVGNV